MQIKRQIMVIHGNSLRLAAIKLALKDEYDVRVSNDINTARMILRRLHTHLCLIDISLPEYSDFLYEQADKQIPVILVTEPGTDTLNSEEREMFANFSTAYISVFVFTQPFKPNTLTSAVRELFRRAQPVRITEPAMVSKFRALRNACEQREIGGIIDYVNEILRMEYPQNLKGRVTNIASLAMTFKYDEAAAAINTLMAE